jgi:hypothetical protein
VWGVEEKRGQFQIDLLSARHFKKTKLLIFDLVRERVEKLIQKAHHPCVQILLLNSLNSRPVIDL